MKLNQRLEFILGMVDNITQPAQRAERAAQSMGSQVNSTQKRIKELNQQAGQLRGLSEMRSEMVRSQQAAKAATARFHQMEKAVAEQGKASGITTRQINEARKAMENANKAASNHRAELTRVTQALKAAGYDTNKLGDSVQRVDAALVRENRELTRQSRALTEATRRQDALNKAKERHNKIMELSGKLAIGGAVGVAGGSMVGQKLLAPIKEGLEFDAEMAAVSAITKSTPEMKEKLREAALLSSSSSQYSAAEVAQGQTFMGMAGMTGDQILASQDAMLALSTATRTSLADTADISTNIMTGLNMKAEQMDRISDVLTNTTTSANTNLIELGEAFKMSSSLMATSGMDIEEGSAILGMLADKSIKATMAGTHLRIMLSRLAGPPKAARKELERLGIETKDATGKLRPLKDVLLDLEDATANMGSADKIASYKKILGAEAFNSGLALGADAKSGKWDERTVANYGAEGRNQAVAREMANELAGDVKTFQSHVSTMMIRFSDLFTTIARFVTQTGTAVIKWIIEFTKENPTLVKVLGLVAAAMVVLTIAAGGLALAMAGALFVTAQMAVMKSKLPTIIRACQLAMSRLTFAYAQNSVMAMVARIRTMALSAALLAQNVALRVLRAGMAATAVVARITGVSMTLAFGLIGVAIAAVIAAGVLLYKHWDKVKAFGAGMWEGFKAGMAPVVKMFDDLMVKLGPTGEALRQLGAWLGRVWDGFVALFSPVKSTSEELKAATAAGVSFGEYVAFAIKATMVPMLAFIDVLTWVGESLGTFLAMVVTDPSGTLQAIWGGISDFMSLLWENPMQAFNNMIDAVIGRAKSVYDWFANLFGSDESVKLAVDEAPAAKGSGNVNPKAPATVKGNQIQPPKPVVNNNVQSTTNVTINGSSLSQAELQAAIKAAMADSQRAHDRKVRGGLYD